MSEALAKVSFMWAIALLVTLASARRVPAQAGFVQTSGTRFVLNGSPFLLNGFNSYWMMNVASQPTQRFKVSDVFSQAAAAGLSVCRTWAFADGGNGALQQSPGVYNEPMFQGLDFVISEARRHGIRLILSLTNNYHDFGGRPQYVSWARSAGASVTSDDDFYTHPVVKGFYKNHVKKVLTRINTITRVAYKDDPTIMAWELINEPRCQADYSGKTINSWVQEMATYVKSIDNKHLLEIGMEGFYGDSVPDRKQNNPGYQVGTDFITNNMIKEIDFTTIHAYPDQWLPGQGENAHMQFIQKWLTSHWADSKNVLKKPLVFSEFGRSSKEAGFSIGVRDSFLNTIYMNIYKLARDGGDVAGGMVWQLMAEGMESYFDGYEIVLSQNPSTGGVIAQQSSKMAALAHILTNDPHRHQLHA